MDFKDKRVLVTGGTRGIGRATVEAFLAAGARVAVNGRSEASTARALDELGAGDRAIAAPGGAGIVEDCQRVVETAVTRLAGLDVLVNNAGVFGEAEPIEQITPEGWDRTINVNLRGTAFCIKYAVPALRESRGNVVDIASIDGLQGGGIGASAYCASKGAVVNLTRDLAVELAPDIRVNCLCPGPIDTDMLRGLGELLGDGGGDAGYDEIREGTPMKRIAQTVEMANAILYLASDMASFVTGAIHVADGGRVARE